MGAALFSRDHHSLEVHSADLPVRACGAAKLGTVAASWGMELRSGSGVLRGGERAKGVMRTRDLIWKREPIWSMRIWQCSLQPSRFCPRRQLTIAARLCFHSLSILQLRGLSCRFKFMLRIHIWGHTQRLPLIPPLQRSHPGNDSVRQWVQEHTEVQRVGIHELFECECRVGEFPACTPVFPRILWTGLSLYPPSQRPTLKISSLSPKLSAHKNHWILLEKRAGAIPPRGWDTAVFISCSIVTKLAQMWTREWAAATLMISLETTKEELKFALIE